MHNEMKKTSQGMQKKRKDKKFYNVENGHYIGYWN